MKFTKMCEAETYLQEAIDVLTPNQDTESIFNAGVTCLWRYYAHKYFKRI